MIPSNFVMSSLSSVQLQNVEDFWPGALYHGSVTDARQWRKSRDRPWEEMAARPSADGHPDILHETSGGDTQRCLNLSRKKELRRRWS